MRIKRTAHFFHIIVTFSNMIRQSAGIVLYRVKENQLQVLLGHPGGPYWKNKDQGGWSIPKGEAEENEDLLEAAVREVKEETGWTITGKFIPLNAVRQGAGKTVHAWAVAGDYDHRALKSNSFEIEWPPRSGKLQSFPEIDKADWFTLEEAKEKIHSYQAGFLDQLADLFENNRL